MGKYRVGQEVVINGVIDAIETNSLATYAGKPYKIKYGKKNLEYDFVSEEVLDASNPMPPLAPEGWEPKVGDRVMVECTVANGPDNDGDYTVKTTYSKSSNWQALCNRSSILGPAPVKSRFSVGDEVFLIDRLAPATVKIVNMNGTYTVSGVYGGWVIACDDGNMLTLAEAKERLAK